MPLKLMIAEDHEFTRTGLAYSLRNKSDYDIVAEASNGIEAIRLAEVKQPDLILMDIGMPEMDGITAARKIKALSPQVKIVMLTSRQFKEEVFAALASGADAYCMKDITTDRLVQVLDTVMGGAVWLDPAIARVVTNALPQPGQQFNDKDQVCTQLTEREREVLYYLAQGKSNKDIADQMHLSINTVKSHVRSLIQKLAVDDRTQAALKAITEGLIPNPQP